MRSFSRASTRRGRRFERSLPFRCTALNRAESEFFCVVTSTGAAAGQRPVCSHRAAPGGGARGAACSGKRHGCRWQHWPGGARAAAVGGFAAGSEGLPPSGAPAGAAGGGGWGWGNTCRRSAAAWRRRRLPGCPGNETRSTTAHFSRGDELYARAAAGGGAEGEGAAGVAAEAEAPAEGGDREAQGEAGCCCRAAAGEAARRRGASGKAKKGGRRGRGRRGGGRRGQKRRAGKSSARGGRRKEKEWQK